MFSYTPLLCQLVKRKMAKKDLGLAPATLAKLAKDEPVNMQTLNEICNKLDCRIEDVIEFRKDDDSSGNECL